MPKRRRTYGGRKPLSKPVFQYARMLQRHLAAKRRAEVISSLPELGNGYAVPTYRQPPTLVPAAELLQPQAVATGGGSYGWGKVAGSAMGSVFHGMGGSRRQGRKVGKLLYQTGARMRASGGYVPVGRGDYSGYGGVPVNSLIQGSNVTVPRMQGGDEIGSVVISHREFLGNITGSQLFENSTFQLNPGLVDTFPWLSQIAANYEEYSFEQLMFTYVSLLSEATSSGAVGTIIMSTNYNAGNPAFLTSNDMLNNIGTISARPTDTPIIHGVECDDNKNVLPSYYVRVGEVPEGQDIKTYDVGLFQLATEGMPVSDQLQGQLYVSYQITLRKPKLFTAAGKGIRTDVFKAFGSSSLTKMAGPTIYASPFNILGTTVSHPASNTIRINFPLHVVQGVFRIELGFLAPTEGGVYPPSPKMNPVVTYSNCDKHDPTSYAENWSDNSTSNQTASYGGLSANFRWQGNVILLGSFAIPTYVDFTWSSLTSFASARFQLNVIQVNPRNIADAANVPDPTWHAINL
jgi:hypothetical protein